MADFKTAFPIVRKNEGGYANNPNDRGGETYKGISRKNWPDWKGWKIIDSYKKFIGGFEAALAKDQDLQNEVLAFYKLNFWDDMNLDQVNDQAISQILFDCAVNMSDNAAGKFLQRALNALNRKGTLYPNIEVDGRIGAKTIQMLNNHKYPERVKKIVNSLRIAKYVGISENDESQEEFMAGWVDRVIF
jgi:lysozyme family protein